MIIPSGVEGLAVSSLKYINELFSFHDFILAHYVSICSGLLHEGLSPIILEYRVWLCFGLTQIRFLFF